MALETAAAEPGGRQTPDAGVAGGERIELLARRSGGEVARDGARDDCADDCADAKAPSSSSSSTRGGRGGGCTTTMPHGELDMRVSDAPTLRRSMKERVVRRERELEPRVKRRLLAGEPP